MSHPTWVRGLKLVSLRTHGSAHPSHPTWVRGLKLMLVSLLHILSKVAPYVGAWIETDMFRVPMYTNKSHPTWVRGLKLSSVSL